MRTPPRPSLTALLVVALLGCGRAARADVIVPAVFGGVDADSNNAFPFNIGDFGLISLRYQQVYDAAEFPGPVVITGLVFRPDAGTGAAFSSLLPSIRIDLSTSLASVGGLSTVFADNVGPDAVTVFNGPLWVSSALSGPASGPMAFDIAIPFSTPFAYDPVAGNLLLDVRNVGGGFTTQFDSTDSAPGITSRLITIGDDGVNDASGYEDSGGLVTQFRTAPAATAVPEPVSIVLLATGLARALTARRRLLGRFLS